MMQDTISDMLTRMRNALSAKNKDVVMPSSKFRVALCELLKKEGYIDEYFVYGDVKPVLKITLKYYNGRPVCELLKRVSKPGLRVYKNCTDIPEVMNGFGIAVVSTSQGLVSDHTARQRGLGGEIICYVA